MKIPMPGAADAEKVVLVPEGEQRMRIAVYDPEYESQTSGNIMTKMILEPTNPEQAECDPIWHFMQPLLPVDDGLPAQEKAKALQLNKMRRKEWVRFAKSVGGKVNKDDIDIPETLVNKEISVVIRHQPDTRPEAAGALQTKIVRFEPTK